MSDSESSTTDSEIRKGINVLTDTDEQEQEYPQNSDEGVELEEREEKAPADDERQEDHTAEQSSDEDSTTDEDGTDTRRRKKKSDTASVPSKTAAVPTTNEQNTETAKEREDATADEGNGSSTADERQQSSEKDKPSKKLATSERERGSKSVTPKPVSRKTHSRRATEVRTTSGPHVKHHAHGNGHHNNDSSVSTHLDIAKEDSTSISSSEDDADDLTSLRRGTTKDSSSSSVTKKKSTRTIGDFSKDTYHLKRNKPKIVSEPHCCPICFGKLRAPILLSCFHTVCRDCVEKTVEMRKGIMVCPVCQKETVVDKKHLDINYIEADYYKAQDIIVKNHNCDICLPASEELTSQSEGSTSSTAAVAYCCDCDQYLCEAHQRDHRRIKCTANHELIAINGSDDGKTSQTQQPKVKSACQIHPDEEYVAFCISCGVLICNKCKEGHIEHRVESLQRYYTNNKTEFDALVEQSIAAAKKLQKAINLIDLELISLSENKTTANVEISEWRKGIERLIDVRCDGINSEIDGVVERKRKGIQDFLDGLNKTHRTLSNMIDFACEAREVGGVQILNLKSVLTPALAGAGTIRSIDSVPTESVKNIHFINQNVEEIEQVFKSSGAIQTAKYTPDTKGKPAESSKKESGMTPSPSLGILKAKSKTVRPKQKIFGLRMSSPYNAEPHLRVSFAEEAEREK